MPDVRGGVLSGVRAIIFGTSIGDPYPVRLVPSPSRFRMGGGLTRPTRPSVYSGFSATRRDLLYRNSEQ